MKVDLMQESENLLNKCSACSVSEVTEDGYPRICILVPIKKEGIKTLYFSTGTSSKKIQHYKKNDKAGVTFYFDGDSVTLIGKMTIIEDEITKDDLWQDWLENHFPNGGKRDPEYAVIKFVAEVATIYIGEQFETIKVK